MDVMPADINKTGLACDNHKNRNRRGPLDHSNLSAPLKVNGGPRVATADIVSGQSFSRDSGACGRIGGTNHWS